MGVGIPKIHVCPEPCWDTSLQRFSCGCGWVHEVLNTCTSCGRPFVGGKWHIGELTQETSTDVAGRTYYYWPYRKCLFASGVCTVLAYSSDIAVETA